MSAFQCNQVDKNSEEISEESPYIYIYIYILTLNFCLGSTSRQYLRERYEFTSSYPIWIKGFVLFCLFNGISTSVGNLIQNPSW